jgi:acetyl-CoA C-acetyltransferase
MYNDNDIVILGYARTAIGDFLGSLRDVPLVDLTSIVVEAAINRSGIKPEDVDELAMGCIYKHGNGGNPARQVEIKVGIPSSAWAYTVDQQCASGMKSLDIVRRSLMTGGCRLGVVAGSEVMSRAPYLSLNGRTGFRMGDVKLIDSLTKEGLSCAIAGYHMGVTAENLAVKYNVTRQEQDELAVMSHQRAIAAIDAGCFEADIVPVPVKVKKAIVEFKVDEHPRRDISLEIMAKMKPVFKPDGGTVTAGNASGINDAACAMVVTTGKYCKERGLTPVARILTTASCGVPAEIMGIGPAFVIPKALEEVGLSKDAIDYWEINEAFAAQFLACNRELRLDMAKVNRNGSGIGLGHPVGCTGARIIMACISEMKAKSEHYGVASLCVGGGPAMATVIEML